MFQRQTVSFWVGKKSWSRPAHLRAWPRSVVSYFLLLLQHHHTSFDCIMKGLLFNVWLFCCYFWLLLLVEGFNPSEKYESNWIMKPQGSGVEIKHIWNHHLVVVVVAAVVVVAVAVAVAVVVVVLLLLLLVVVVVLIVVIVLVLKSSYLSTQKTLPVLQPAGVRTATSPEEEA